MNCLILGDDKMRTEYRNATRSKVMIKKAFIELLKVKPANKITVTDIIKKADVSRGTFYSHFLDTRDLLESFQRDFLDQLTNFIHKHQEDVLVDCIDLLLQKMFTVLKSDLDTYRVLANQDFMFGFYLNMKHLLITELVKGHDVPLEVERSLNIYVGGLIMTLREWLENPDFDQMEDMIKTFSRLIHQGIII